MVKLRKQDSSQTVYYKNDFHQSFVNVGQATNDLLTLINQLQLIPSVNDRQRGILTIFRKGIEPMWEDVKNKYGSIVRFSMFQSQNFDQSKIKNDRKYAPVVEDQQSIILLFITLILTDRWKEYLNSAQINGLYIKTDTNTTTFEIWTNTASASSDLIPHLKDIFAQLNFKSEFNIGEKQVKIDLADTIKITQLEQGTTRGKSYYSTISSNKQNSQQGERSVIDRSQGPKLD